MDDIEKELILADYHEFNPDGNVYSLKDFTENWGKESDKCQIQQPIHINSEYQNQHLECHKEGKKEKSKSTNKSSSSSDYTSSEEEAPFAEMGNNATNTLASSQKKTVWDSSVERSPPKEPKKIFLSRRESSDSTKIEHTGAHGLSNEVCINNIQIKQQDIKSSALKRKPLKVELTEQDKVSLKFVVEKCPPGEIKNHTELKAYMKTMKDTRKKLSAVSYNVMRGLLVKYIEPAVLITAVRK